MGRPSVSTKRCRFPAFETFVPVIATDMGRLLDGLHTLRVQDGRAGMGLPAPALALSSMQVVVHAGRGTSATTPPRGARDENATTPPPTPTTCPPHTATPT